MSVKAHSLLVGCLAESRTGCIGCVRAVSLVFLAKVCCYLLNRSCLLQTDCALIYEFGRVVRDWPLLMILFVRVAGLQNRDDGF